MAYRANTDARTRVAAMIVVAGLHAGMALLLSSLALRTPDNLDSPPLHSFDISLPEPPPPVEVEVKKADTDVVRDVAGESAANIESLASPIVFPDPLVEMPPVNPIIASSTPNIGFNATQGASDRAGDGTGAGGSGAGTGAASGGEGNGAGEGTRVSVIERTKFNIWDYSRDSRRAWRDASRVMVVVMVQTNGRATDCEVKFSSGNADIDAETCRLVERKVRFRPALDAQGQPYATPFGYIQYQASGR